MKGRTRWVILPGLALLLLTLLFSCSWISGDAGAQIAINIANYSTRAIGVTEYEVTGLEIEVFDPAGMPLEEFEWDPGDGATQYLIPVRQSGQHQVVVTHIGDGGAFEAVESSFFDIEPMIVTVITIVPGMIGVFQVEGEGGGEPPCPCDELVGWWEGEMLMGPAPYWAEIEFSAAGVATAWIYDAPGGDLVPPPGGSIRGTYTCDCDELIVEWTHGYENGEWIDLGGSMPGGLPFTIEDDVLTMEADTDGDGIPDFTMTFTRMPDASAIVGTWHLDGTFSIYMPFPPDTMTMDIMLTVTMFRDGRCESTGEAGGLSQWGYGIYVYDEAAETIQIIYDHFEMPIGTVNPIPPQPVSECFIVGDTMTIIMPPGEMTWADPMVYTRI